MDGHYPSTSTSLLFTSDVLADGKLAIAGVISIAFGCVTLYQAYRPSEPKVDKKEPTPSQEVLMLMMMFGSSLPLCISGYFVSPPLTRP